MTTALLLARDCIICWVNVWLAPVECAFDLIESELVRRGVELEAAEHPSRTPPDHPDWSSDMLNVIKVFDVMHVDPATGRSVWTGLTGHANGPQARRVHDRPKGDGLLPDRMARRARLSRCRTRAPASAPLGCLTMRRNHFVVRSRAP